MGGVQSTATRWRPYTAASTTDPSEVRKAALKLLALPFVFVPIALALAVGMKFDSDLAQRGSVRLVIAGASHLSLIVALLLGPGYAASCAWYWRRTRAAGAAVIGDLWRVPLVAAALAWCPAAFMAPASAESRLQVLPWLAASSLLLGYGWIGCVRWLLHLMGKGRE